MKELNYLKINKIACVGIGGEGQTYLAKFFHLLGVDIEGSDISENERVKELKSLGIRINLKNPDKPFSKDTDFYIYTNALSDELKENLKKLNPGVTGIEVGKMYDILVTDYEAGRMSEKVKLAFNNSEVAPLYELDYSKMKYIGVTGTDGKTTTTTMIYHILKDQGFKPALISSVSAKIGDEEIDTGFHVTTPSSQELYKLLKKVEDEKCTHVVIEATSHGLSMCRLAGIKFDVAVYTNITNEHLDYFGTWKGLFEAKSRLITRHLKDSGFAVLNKDDKSFSGLSKLTNNFISYSQNSLEHERRAIWLMDLVSGEGLSFKFGMNFNNKSFRNIEVDFDLIGDYNISNSLAAISACHLLGIEPDDTVSTLSGFETVEGRMQVLQQRPFQVIVDFAHTSNALRSALGSVRELTKNKLIVVFGCAGQRDKYKRFEMGKIVAELADITIVTAEDPRTEKLSDINDEIERGWKSVKTPGKKFIRFDNEKDNVESRRDAIKKALDFASEEDTVIITGKAHEKSLCFGTEEYPWNDIEETEKLLK